MSQAWDKFLTQSSALDNVLSTLFASNFNASGNNNHPRNGDTPREAVKLVTKIYTICRGRDTKAGTQVKTEKYEYTQQS